MGKIVDLEGQKFGKITVIGLSHIKRLAYRKCRCECGNEKIIRSRSLISGLCKSCGCIRIEIIGKLNKTHGLGHTRFNNIRHNIKQRTTNKNIPQYKNWGGRGIKCLWRCFEEFKDDMYESYLKHVEIFGENNTSIDRIDNDGNYCKDNCKWATKLEQCNNKTSNHYIEYNGKILTINGWSRELGISRDTIRRRINRGLTIENVLYIKHKNVSKNIG